MEDSLAEEAVEKSEEQENLPSPDDSGVSVEGQGRRMFSEKFMNQ